MNMEKAFVCIQCQSGKDRDVLQKLNKIPNVESCGTLGVYDIVATVESNSMDSMMKIITDQIRKINGITSTITLLQTEEDDLIPDVIPEEKKIHKPDEDQEIEEEEEDYDDDDDYEEKDRKS